MTSGTVETAQLFSRRIAEIWDVTRIRKDFRCYNAGPHMTEETIRSIQDLVAFQSKLDSSGRLCFRGQANAGWNLIPTAYRGLESLSPPFQRSDTKWIGEVERDIYRTFAREAARFFRGHSHLNWNSLFVAQHYGAPTRLLDWTWNIIVAAYFSVISDCDRDGAIWALDLGELPFPEGLGKRPRNSAFSLPAVDEYVRSAELDFFAPFSKFAIPGSASPEEQTIADRPTPNVQTGYHLFGSIHLVGPACQNSEAGVTSYD